MKNLKKLLKKIGKWASLLAVPTLIYVDMTKETLYLNEKFEEITKNAMIDLIKANNYLQYQEYDSSEIYGLRAMIKFEDWEDLSCDYFFNKEILKFLNKEIIEDFKSYGLGIYYKAIDERARRRNSFA